MASNDPWDLIVFSKHYGEHAGVFVVRWVRELEKRGMLVKVNPKWTTARYARMIVAHWLWPAGVKAYVLSLLFAKPFGLVLHGDPFMIRAHWWVRWPALVICRRAAYVQVVSTVCHNIMEDYGIRCFLAPMPDGVGDREPDRTQGIR